MRVLKPGHTGSFRQSGVNTAARRLFTRTARGLLGPGVAAAVVALVTSHAAAVTLTVGPFGDYDSIQEGLDAAAPGDTVAVSFGTYSGTQNTNLDFGGKAVTLRSESGPSSTAIDCQNAARAFTFTSGEDTTSVVRGFSILNGHDDNDGGAVYCLGSSPLFADCVFEGNSSGTPGSGGRGGAVYAEQSHIVVEGCLFRDNTGDDGAGMFTRYSTASIRNSRFLDNVATHGGGGLRILSDGGTITGCTFAGNTAPVYGGGVYFCYSSPVFRNCTLAYNAASQGGGAYGYDATPTFTNCIVAHSPEGAAFYCPGASAFTIEHCCIYGNAGGDDPCGDAGDNIFEDPLLCQSDEGELRLQDCSPCIGTGEDGEDIGAWETGCPCGDETKAPEPPGPLSLSACPNPARDGSVLTYEVPPGCGGAAIAVYNLSGRVVAGIAGDELPSRKGRIRWDGTDRAGKPVASGVYFARLTCGELTTSARLVVVR
ncbi:MAG: T9SS type A sorting domain-containing protein [Candidatus Eisenbacteria bacterium]|nr:T9SS type A sorting domain-containing protein [Candidatus Eisenbacteria bacterium]